MSNLEKINVLTKDKLDSLDTTQYPNQIFGTTDEVAEGGGSGSQRTLLDVSILDNTQVIIPAVTSTIIPFAQQASLNAENKLTLKDNKIIVGKGVSKILMSGSFRAYGPGSSVGTWCAIKKNGNNVKSLPFLITNSVVHTVPLFLVDVQEGDTIQVNIFDQEKQITILNEGTNKETSFILEVVE